MARNHVHGFVANRLLMICFRMKTPNLMQILQMIEQNRLLLFFRFYNKHKIKQLKSIQRQQL